MPIYLTLKDVLQKRGITQKQLSQMTGIHEGTISELVRDTKTAINKEHLDKIMDALEITDISEVIKRVPLCYRPLL